LKDETKEKISKFSKYKNSNKKNKGQNLIGKKLKVDEIIKKK